MPEPVAMTGVHDGRGLNWCYDCYGELLVCYVRTVVELSEQSELC